MECIGNSYPTTPAHRTDKVKIFIGVLTFCFYARCGRQVARTAAVAQRTAAEREGQVYLHAKREADRAERQYHASGEVGRKKKWR